MGHGLRQDDPISPFLFFIVAKGFNKLVEMAMEMGRFHGYKFDGGVDQFSHLQYAEHHNYLKNMLGNIQTIKTNLTLLEIMTGLKVNYNNNVLVGINTIQ